jgi:hypothetical protein
LGGPIPNLEAAVVVEDRNAIAPRRKRRHVMRPIAAAGTHRGHDAPFRYAPEVHATPVEVADQQLVTVRRESQRVDAVAGMRLGLEPPRRQPPDLEVAGDVACRQLRAVARERDAGDGAGELAQRAKLGAAALLPEVTPLPAAPVLLTRARAVALEQLDRAAAVVFGQGLAGEIDVGGVEVVARPGFAGLGATPLPGHAGKTGDQDQHGHGECGRELGLPSAPANRFAQQPGRAGANRLILQETAQFVGEFPGGAITAGDLLLEALQADRLQVPRHAGVQQSGRNRLGGADLLEGFRDRVGLERRAPRNQAVQHGAERIDVAGRADLAMAPFGLFGGQVIGRAEHLAGECQVRGRSSGLRSRIQPLGQPEVGDARLAEGVDEDVGRLEVAVQNAPLVRVVDSLRDSLEVGGSAPGRQGPVADELREVLALDEVHREERLAVVLADVMDGNDVRVLQPGGGFRLGAKSPQGSGVGLAAGQDHLEGNDAVQA